MKSPKLPNWQPNPHRTDAEFFLAPGFYRDPRSVFVCGCVLTRSLAGFSVLSSSLSLPFTQSLPRAIRSLVWGCGRQVIEWLEERSRTGCLSGKPTAGRDYVRLDVGLYLCTSYVCCVDVWLSSVVSIPLFEGKEGGGGGMMCAQGSQSIIWEGAAREENTSTLALGYEHANGETILGRWGPLFVVL